MGMEIIFANNATSQLLVATPAGSISIQLPSGEGAKYPQPDATHVFMATIEDRRTKQLEIVKCTGRSGDIIQVTRGQEGTVPQDFAPGATFSNRMTAGTLDWFMATAVNNAGYSKTEADDRFVNIDGDAMTGPLTLNTSPTQALHAATKDYVDFHDQNLQTQIGTKIGDAPNDGQRYIRQSQAWVTLATYLTDAPVDGKIYGRSDNAWLETVKYTDFSQFVYAANDRLTNVEGDIVDINNSALPEAPVDNKQYARKNQTWSEVIIPSTNWADIGGKPAIFPPDPEAIDDRVATLLIAGTNITLSYNDSADTLTINALGGAGGGIPEAPTDGQTYGRRGADATWQLVTGGGIVEAPNDGGLYGRQALSWQKGVKLSGDTLTGFLSVHAQPTSNLHVVNKAYVDTNFASVAFVNSGDALRVAKAGDTMTGPLVLPGSGVAAATMLNFGTAGTGFFGTGTALFAATAAGIRFSLDSVNFIVYSPIRAPDGVAGLPGLNFSSAANSGVFYSSGVNISVGGTQRLRVSTTAITSTLPITLPADPTANLEAATKQYVDNKPGAPDNTKVLKTGDTMTGPLVMPLGTAAATSINFGTAGTGLYGAGTTAVSVACSGVDKLTVAAGSASFTVPLGLPATSIAGSTALNFGTPGTGFYGAAASISAAISGVDKLTLDATTLTSVNPIVLPAANPTLSTQAAHKGYVDTGDTARVARIGDTMSGFLVLHADPDAAMKAATKQYVDAKKSLISMSDTAPASPTAGQLWLNTTTMSLFVHYYDGDTSQWVQTA